MATALLDVANKGQLTDDQLVGLIQTLERESNGLTGATEKVDAETQAKIDNAAATAGMITKIDELANKLTASMNPLFGMRDAELKLADSKTKVAEAETTLFFATKALDDARRTGNQADIAKAEDDLAKAVRGLTEANNGQISAAMAMETAERSLEKALLNGDVTIEGAITTINGWRDAGYITAEQAATLTTKVNDLVFSYGLLPPAVSTQVLAPGLADTLRQANELKNTLFYLDGKGIGSYGQGLGVLVPGVNPYTDNSAVGRAVSAQDLTWVGESGVELFVPQTAGFVANAQSRAVQQAKTNDSGSGGVTIYAETNASAADIGREVAWALRTSGR
jgi:hypothetical protein